MSGLSCFELSIFSQTWHCYVHTDSFIYSSYESEEILKQFYGDDSYHRRIKISGSVDALLIELDNALIYYLIIKRIGDLMPPPRHYSLATFTLPCFRSKH